MPPTDDTDDLACPSCGSEDVVPTPEQAHPYKCTACGALFDREHTA
jgi:DNA-directed RNA polymerase subunit RPC12/RpoP